MLFRFRTSFRRAVWLSLCTSLMLLLLTVSRPPAAAGPDSAQATVGRWSPPQQLANSAYGPIIRSAPSGTLLVVYGKAMAGTNSQINPHYQLQPAGGGSWTAAAPIRNSPDNFSQVTAEFDSGSKAHAVWRSDFAVFHAHQDQWATNQFVTVFDNGGYRVLDPDLAIGGDDVLHVVASLQNQTVTAPENIHHAYSTNNGASWTLTPLTNNTDQSRSPGVAVDANGNVHVVWEEWRIEGAEFVYQIYHRTGTKNGGGYSWNTAQVISGSVLTARQPAILVQGDTLHLTFTNLVSDSEQYVYYLRRPAGSTNWTAPVDITGAMPLAVNTNAPFYLVSNMTLCQGNLHTFYYGSPIFDTNEQVYLQQRQTGVWQSRELVTDSGARRVRPSAVCHNNALHLVYEQIVTPNVNHQIYFTSALEQLYLPIIVRN
jgi:hypothetical protein